MENTTRGNLIINHHGLLSFFLCNPFLLLSFSSKNCCGSETLGSRQGDVIGGSLLLLLLPLLLRV
jgi:hypothetical protein